MAREIGRSLRWLIHGLLLVQVQAFYIPGWSVKSYRENDPIPLHVNKIYSDNTQLQYGYYQLPFVCPPTGKHHPGTGFFSGQSIWLNLGEVLRGDRIMASDIELAMQHDSRCKVLCNREINLKDEERARKLIEDGYVVEWIVDNLPGATSFVTADKTKKYYAAGFKLGYKDNNPTDPKYYLYNHHTIVIRYRRAPGKDGDRGGKVIVGFEVYPKSIGVNVKRDETGCPANLKDIEKPFELRMTPNTTSSADSGMTLVDATTVTVPYTYSVYFREDNSVEWNHRWDLYFMNQDEGSKVHWLAIFNSVTICGVLTGIVLIIITKTVRTDIKGYNRELAAEKGRSKTKSSKKKADHGGLLGQEVQEDDNNDDVPSEDEALEDITGWKLLHADVFRPPANGHLLAPLVGSGMQLLFMAFGLVLLSALGIINPSLRGGFISFGVGLFIFGSLFSGYFSSRVYATFSGVDWRSNTLLTATLFPGLLFLCVFILNLFVWAQASSTAIPFTTLIAICLLWLVFQVPLVAAGSYYGHHNAGPWTHPTKTSPIPRQIPRQGWYGAHPLRTAVLAGAIPFAVIFIELLFVFQSLWQDKSGYYYLFGFLAVICLLLSLTIAEVTVVTIYAQLCAENYHWWWQSFLVGGGSAAWVFAYSVWYYFAKLHITGFVSSLLFFCYSFMACVVYGLLAGTVGFLTAFAFVRRIYGAIKAD
ncbi:hypothetical protein DL546_005126 [Coniochaeta pulveracea]|uniref:Transmembrane 9 superfamily member n=1 Tax=Coniochaeta pulveracea TaxID=177199 RepID=A0A420YIC9_9PEZI|nr:hypothetical protein DL546_005126 [Coniochaeta pulveracea]